MLDEPAIPGALASVETPAFLRGVYVAAPPATREVVNGEPVHGGLAYDPDMSLADFLEWLERDARDRCRLLENRMHPAVAAGFTDYFYPPTKRERAAGARIAAAMRLAPDLKTFRALLAGKAVPRARLRQDVIDTVDRMRRG